MLDIKFIRNFPDKVKKGAQNKGVKVDIDKLLKLDERRKEYLKEIEELRAKQNKLSKEEMKEAQEVKAKIKKLEPELENIEQEIDSLALAIPNVPLDDVPVGENEKDNVVIEEFGQKTKFNFEPKDYLELAEKLDLIDIKRAAKVSGSRFGYIKKEAVLLEFALINLAFRRLTKEGFIPIMHPVMLKSEMARGMGYLEQTDKNEAYYVPEDDLYLVGTAEQSLGTMHAGEVLKEKELPLRYFAFSTCFRREAGSYGKDTKGIFRVHQFDKVEMFSFSKPEDSGKEHQLFLEIEKKLMKDLKLTYRVVRICTGDLGFSVASKYDIEAWLPSQGRYRETHSTSNCTDFQARRLNIRYQASQGLDFVHTINGTAFAPGRILIAIIENYQQKDGTIKVPDVLQKYTGFKQIPRGSAS